MADKLFGCAYGGAWTKSVQSNCLFLTMNMCEHPTHVAVISSETRTVESLITYKRSHYLAIWSHSVHTSSKLHDTIGCLFKMSYVWSVDHIRRKTLSDCAFQNTHNLYRNDSAECLLVCPVRFRSWTRESRRSRPSQEESGEKAVSSVIQQPPPPHTNSL